MIANPALISGATSGPDPNAVVYIVEDDTAVRSALDLLARCCGWRARSFASGGEFLDSPIDETASCLVLDLNMPQMDGETVLRHLRERGSRLPVLVITADRSGAQLERLRRLGVYEVLQKPFGDDAFQSAVQGCLSPPAPPPDAADT
ncbi:response regulator [Algiphilus sp. W345]|uniref:Response regulator n=1 Tax=Banduia mediterranea TaxID=3075609 RepID=A0ABU2WMH5_9GAMM|nr:response regulator [Algiphilus sp. W345]MDT0499080.1 response regulator [Algiphilus sp. W345]